MLSKGCLLFEVEEATLDLGRWMQPLLSW